MDDQRRDAAADGALEPVEIPDEAELIARATELYGEEATAPGSPLPAFWDAVKRLPRYARVAAALMKDPAVPKKAKVMLGVGGAYTVSPIDFVPGFIPVAGQLDDVYVLLRALRMALHATPAEIAAGHLHAAGLTMANVEQDLKTVEETVRWLVAQGAKKGGRLAARGYRQLRTGFQRGRAVVQNAAARRSAPDGDGAETGRDSGR